MLDDAKTDIRIRKAVTDDLVELSDFIVPFVQSGELLPRTFDELEDLLETSFIARLDGRIVGCAALEIYNKKLCEIRSLAVDPAAQGLGIGKKLVEACVALAMREGITRSWRSASPRTSFALAVSTSPCPTSRRPFFCKRAIQCNSSPSLSCHENRCIGLIPEHVRSGHVGEHDVEGARPRLAGFPHA